MPKAALSLMTPSSPESCTHLRGVLCDSSPSAHPSRGSAHGQARRTRGPTCDWTADLDSILKIAWTQGGPRAGRRALRKERPSWSWSAVRKHAAKLGLCRTRPPRWTPAEEHQLLWSIDSNASLALIAKRLGRTVAAVRKRLWDLGYKAESLGGYKVKELAEMFGVAPARVQYWVEQQLLLTKGGRITDSSLTKFLAEHPEKVPFRALKPEMQSWLREMGYPDSAAVLPVAGVPRDGGDRQIVAVSGLKPISEP